MFPYICKTNTKDMKTTAEYEARYEAAKARYGSEWSYYDRKEEWVCLAIEADERKANAICGECGMKGRHTCECFFV